jgi:flagellin
MSSILTNNSAMVALQTLKSINSNLAMTQSEISTGKSVSSAKDNSAVWAISKVMEADVNGFNAISDSLSLGESTVAVGQKAAETVTDLLGQMKEKIVSAQSENVDRSKLQTDISALRDQINSVVGAAQFNGLNLVTGTDDVNVLSSLDRSSNGTVTASNITIARQDMTTAAGTYGGGGTSLATNITAGAAAVDSSGDANQLQLTLAGAATDDLTLSIGGNSLTVTWDTDAATTIGAAVTAINALGLTGISATNTGAQLEINSTNSFSSTAVTWNSGATNTVAASNLGDGTTQAAATGAGTDTLMYRAEDVTLSTSANVNEGDSYRVTVNGNNYDYIAGKNETMEDVARGLKTAIDGGGETGVTTNVTQNSSDAWMVQVDYDGTDATAGATMTLTDNGENGGTASGGMFGLDNLDVTTTAGANAALGNIETLINNSIDAAASFGSAAGRIEIQNDFISNLTDSLKSGIGTMVDADMEAASARLQALQVQQQLGTQALSIANKAPQNILSLFR